MNEYNFESKIDVWDYMVVAVYFATVLAAGFYAMYKSNRSTVSGYFLAGRFMFWLPVGASVFASNIGSEHFIGLAGSASANGIGVGAYELSAIAALQMTGWIFLPVFIASGVCTLPEYMTKRFGGNRIRTYLAVLSLILYIFTKISVNLFAGAIFVQQAIHWDLYTTVLLLLAMTAICTVTGGLAAVIYTDTLQFFIMITGATIVAIKAFWKVGGMSAIKEQYMTALPRVVIANSTCGLPQENSFQMLRPYDDPDLPWIGFLLGQTCTNIWYWCTDQMMVQRLLAAKNLSHAQGGTLFAGVMKILPLYLIVIPGCISRIFNPDSVGCVDPEECFKHCGNRAGCSNIAYPRLVLEIMPSGLRGLMVAVMLAALMSDLSSIFNSASTLFTLDIWALIRKKASVRELMIVGRAFVIVMIGMSILWIPVIEALGGGKIFIYLNMVASYLSPPIAAVYVLAILWKRTNEKGAFWGLIFGFTLGASRLLYEFLHPAPGCSQLDLRPSFISKIHYLYFALFLFIITSCVTVAVSYATEPPEAHRLYKTTLWTRFAKDDLCYEITLRTESSAIGINSDQTADATTSFITEKQKDTRVKVVSNRTELFSKLSMLCVWFCGLQQSREGTPYVEERMVTCIKQTTREKILLNISLVVVVSAGFAIMAAYSIQW